MAGYVRQSTANIAAGQPINASPLNAEFNAIQAFAHGTTGHAHDGTVGSGPRIDLTTSVTGVLPIANGGTGASALETLTLTSTDAGAAVAPSLIFYRNSATPAANDLGGRILWQFEDSVGNADDAVQIHARIDDTTSTSEDYSLITQIKIAGTLTTVLTHTGLTSHYPSGSIFNWNSGDVTLTHTANNLTWAGATTYVFDTDLRVTTAGTNTASVVTIDGTQTLANKTLTSPTITGGTHTTFTSTGIDDNATAERLEVNDTTIIIGSSTAASPYLLGRAVDSGYLEIHGGTSVSGVDAILFLYGGTHASKAKDYEFWADGAAVYSYDFSASTHAITGLVDLSAATSGQIKFPAAQNASGDANTLDDYEEGTFTPAMTFGGSATNVTFSNRVGTYTKIGRTVHFHIQITLSSNGTGTGSALVTDLPFTASGSVNFACAVQPISGFAGLTAGVSANVTAGTTTIALRAPNTTGSVAVDHTGCTDTASFYITGTYHV